MTTQTIIEVARGAIQALKSGGATGPFLILVPHAATRHTEEIVTALKDCGVEKAEGHSGSGVAVTECQKGGTTYTPGGDLTTQEKPPTNHV